MLLLRVDMYTGHTPHRLDTYLKHVEARVDHQLEPFRRVEVFQHGGVVVSHRQGV